MPDRHRYLFCLVLIVTLVSALVAQGPVDADYFWPKPPAEARVKYLFSFQEEAQLGIIKSKWRRFFDFLLGVDKKQDMLIKPINVITTKSGKIYVADAGTRSIHVFNQAANRTDRIMYRGETRLESPVGLAIAPDGTLFVSDSKLGFVAAYDESGQYLYSIQGYFQRPTGLYCEGGNLYVVDTVLGKVFVFYLNGVYVGEFGERGVAPGQFNFPVFIAVDQNIFITDVLNFRIQTFDKEHHAVGSFGHQGDQIGDFARPKGLDLDSDGHIYVVDSLFDGFQIFEPDGQLLLAVNGHGRGPGEFSMPIGLHIDDRDRIFIADSMNGRVQVFQYLK